MAIICPNCKEEIKQTAQLCERNNCKTFRNKINRIIKETEGLSGRNKLWEKINDSIQEKVTGAVITVNIVSTELNLKGTTKGDLIRDFLDIMTCMGILSKDFKPAGMGGNVYYKQKTRKQCESMITETINKKPKRRCSGQIKKILLVESEDFVRKKDLE